jgi:hypothetical protein
MPHLFMLVSIVAIAVTTAIAGAVPKSTSAMTHTPSLLDADQLPCFASNADIAGVGVRVSTYAQSFLLFFTTLLCIRDGDVDSGERQALERSYANLLITACALLISALVQAVTSQLSIFHALVVLDWSWMLTINALILSILPTIDHLVEIEWGKWLRSFLPARIGQLRAMILVSLHMTFMGAFGVYIWWHPAKFQGPDPGQGNTTGPGSAVCLQRTITYVFFAPIRASNPKLRIASIVFYSIIALPIINVAVLTTIAMLIIQLIMMPLTSCCKKRHGYTLDLPYTIAWGVQSVANIVIVINTERTIWANRHLISGGESTWGFGQIIAVILVVGPFIEAFSVVKEKFPREWMGQIDYWSQPILREGTNTWLKLNHRERWAIDDISTKVKKFDQHLDKDTREAIIGAITSATQFFQAARTAMRLNPWLPAQTDKTQVQEDTETKGLDKHAARTEMQSQGPSPSWLHARTASETTQVQEDLEMSETKLPPLLDEPVQEWQTAKYHITQLQEEVSKLCQLRLPHVHNMKSFLAARGNLRATKEALDAALCAFEAY